MNRLLIAFIRQRMPNHVDVNLGELIDAAEQFFKVKIEARTFFDALRVVLRERRDRRRNRFIEGR
jgi:hypothetical protein